METIAKNKPLAISLFLLGTFILTGSLGLASGIIGSFVYLVVLFPILFGFVIGHITYRNALDLKINYRPFVLAISVLSVLLFYLAFHYGKYIMLHVSVNYELFGWDFSDMNLQATQRIVRQALMEESGETGIIGYLIYKAKEGISIGKLYSSSRLVLKGWLAWLYWFVEVGITTYFALITSKDVFKKPEIDKA